MTVRVIGNLASSYLAQGNQFPSAGTSMQIDRIAENIAAAFPVANEGGIWASTAYAYTAVSQSMTASTVPGQGSSGPLSSLFVYANNNGATAPVVAVIGDAVARVASGVVFGANFIARTASVSGCKLIGIEIDIEPAAGVTIASTSCGLILNIFSISSAAAVCQVGTISGGSWANGFITSAIRGAHYSVLSGDATTATSFINTANGTFSNTAIVTGTGAGQALNLGGGAFGTSPYVFGSSGGDFTVNMGTSGLVVLQAPGGAQAFTFNQFGAINTPGGAMAISTSGTQRVVISAVGAVTINAPTSGVTLTVSGLSGTHSTKIADSATNSFNAGFLEIPQNSQSAAYTTVRSDSGKHIYHPSADTTARTWTIDSNANVPYPIGTAITFDNDTSAGVITLAITTDTLVWLPSGSQGSRTIAPNGQGTALKVGATRWHLTGVGIT